MTPFALLQDIANRCKSHAADLPSRIEAVNYWRGVGFVLGGKRYVASMADVSEILTPPKLTQVPGVKHWVQGVANVRGRLVPIMDLAAFLGERTTGQRNKRVLVIEQGDLINGLLVDAVLGMQHFPEDSMQPIAQDEADERLGPYVIGQYRRGDENWPVFSIEALLENEHYMDIAV